MKMHVRAQAEVMYELITLRNFLELPRTHNTFPLSYLRISTFAEGQQHSQEQEFFGVMV
jgi:hypothetical protein